MKTPPLLLGCALFFWGWQAEQLWAGVVMGAVLEASRWIKVRWDFTDDEFRRIVMFCELTMLAALVYAFTANEGPESFSGLVADPTAYGSQRIAGAASTRTALAVIRWLPMVLFLFIAAQSCSTRTEIPLVVGSLFQWRRRKKAERAGLRWPLGRTFNPGWPYFAVCLASASMHGPEVPGFFWGFVVLMAWALWTLRSRRYSVLAWGCALAVAAAAGFSGQRGVLQIQALLGRYNPQWIAAMLARGRTDPTRSKTAIGEIGRIAQSGKIAIRVQIPPGKTPPPLLREASYTGCRSGWWLGGAANQTYEDVSFEANLTSWNLQPGWSNTDSVTIAAFLPGRRGVLPLPSGCRRLDRLDVESLKTNRLGVAWAEGPGLVIFNACYASGPTIDSPPTGEDLRVPNEETNALDRVISELNLAGFDDAQKRLKVQAFFADHFTYSIWQLPPKRLEETPLSRFLLETRSGHCEFFATATTLLLRRLGIPARYGVGYVVHEHAGANKYVVRLRDAHAWTLVWNATTGTWEDFDTTPGTRNEIEAARASPFQFLSDGWSWVWFEFSKFRWGQGQVRQYIFWGLVPVLGFLLFQIVFRKKWRRSSKKSAAAREREWPGRDSEFYQLERRLASYIGARHGDEALLPWLEQAIAEPSLADLRGPLRGVLELHYRYRFDPRGLSATERESLRRVVGDCLQRFAAMK